MVISQRGLVAGGYFPEEARGDPVAMPSDQVDPGLERGAKRTHDVAGHPLAGQAGRKGAAATWAG